MSPSETLAGVGILELLRHDDRPTFALETSPNAGPYSVVFRNAALDAFLAQHTGTEGFEDWTQSFEVGSKEKEWRFGGRIWTSTRVGGTCLVVYCSQSSHIGETQTQDQTPLRDARIDSANDTTIPSWRLLSSKTLDSASAKVLDWTRFDIPGLPSHLQCIKNFDWASTPLGAIENWPGRLSSLVVSICSNPDPRVLIWGQEMTMIYNEACIPRLGEKHPLAMGKSAAEVYAEIWPQLVDLLKPALLEGQAVKVTKELSFHERNGILEESYWNFIIFPVVGPDGCAIGAIDSFTELTSHVLSQRRREVTSKLHEAVYPSGSIPEIWSQCLLSLEKHPEDLPFAIIYTNDDDDSSATSSSWTNPSRTFRLHGTLGIESSNLAIPKSFGLANAKPSYGLARACQDAWDSRQTVVLRRHDSTIPLGLSVPIAGRGWEDPIEAVCVMPVTPNGHGNGHGTIGFLVVGLNPRRPFNDESLQFAEGLRDVLAKASSELSQQRFEEIHDNLSRELKISTLRAARNEEKFTRMAESAPVGICTFRPDGKPLYVNDQYLDLVGTPREFDWPAIWDTSAAWRDNILPEDLPNIAAAWQTLLERKKTSVTIEYRLNRPWLSIDKATGSELTGETWLMNKAVAELDENDNVMYIHAWLLDTSYQHYTEALLAQRLENALETKRASENFIDMVSHELRNPLSAILQSADGILTTLEGTEAEKGGDAQSIESVVESAQTIILCAQHQKCIVDDILTLSKLDSNLLVITPDRIQPPQLLGKVLKMYDAELQRASVGAELKIESSYKSLLGREDHVMLDPSRLLQVVINLLTNAIKFTQYATERKLTLYLGASRERPTGLHHNLTFIDPRTTRHEHSTALTSEWGDGHDIFLQLAVQDTGRGLSEEEISLLFQRFSQANPKTYKQYGGSGLGLFISRELTELQGGQIGVSSKGVGRGSTFAFYVRARQCHHDSEVDHGSPVALQHVWNTPVTGSTALPSSKVLDPPPQDSIPESNHNPIRPKKKRERSQLSMTTQEPLHVLVVEDNLINQKVMAQQLRKQDCVVHIANHGVEALAFLESTVFCAPTAEKPAPSIRLDVVLMDLEMPVMDGLTCVREIRSRQASGSLRSHIPVIAVTANARSEQMQVARNAGMDHVVTKPFRVPELIPQMRDLVSKIAEADTEMVDGEEEEAAPSSGLGI